MPRTKLFDVVEMFTVKGRGLVLVIESDTASNVEYRREYRPLVETILVTRPDQSSQTFQAIIELEHFSLIDSEGKHAGGKYAFAAIVSEATPTDIPVNSQVFGSDTAYKMVYGKNPPTLSV